MPSRAIVPALSALVLVVASALLLGPTDARSAASWAWPVEGEVLTEYRNGGDPYAGGQHRGIDIAAGLDAPAVAAVAGTVRFRGVAGSNGLTVSIRTTDGRFDTSYLHLASATVEKGQAVSTGERIGTVGSSGRRSVEAPHLHFGVREAGTRHAYLDPRVFLGPLPAPAPTEPRGAPAPVEVPVPATPAPVALPAPVGSPSPVRVPAGRRVRVPAARRVRVPTRAPSPARPASGRVRVPAASAEHAAAPEIESLPALEAKPAGSASGGPASLLDVPGVGPEAVAQPGRARAAEPMARQVTSPSAAPPSATASPRQGLDVGWAIACVGLLLAAACLGGRPSADEKQPRAGRAVLRSLLKPLTGGR